MMYKQEAAYLVYNGVEFRIYSNSRLAYEMTHAIGGKCEIYESPILVLYRLKELMTEYPKWNLKMLRINDMDLTPQVEAVVKSTNNTNRSSCTGGAVPIMDCPQYTVKLNMRGDGYAPYGG